MKKKILVLFLIILIIIVALIVGAKILAEHTVSFTMSAENENEVTGRFIHIYDEKGKEVAGGTLSTNGKELLQVSLKNGKYTLKMVDIENEIYEISNPSFTVENKDMSYEIVLKKKNNKDTSTSEAKTDESANNISTKNTTTNSTTTNSASTKSIANENKKSSEEESYVIGAFEKYLKENSEIKDYKIESVKIVDREELIKTVGKNALEFEDSIPAEVVYSVKPVPEKFMEYTAGDGEEDGEWIKNKSACIEVVNTTKGYSVTKIETGW